LMLLDEELTESMRQHRRLRTTGLGSPGARVGDSIVDFECTDLPPSPMVVEQSRNSGSNNNGGSPIPDFRDFDAGGTPQVPLGVSTDNIGLLILSGLQNMGAAAAAYENSGLAVARQSDVRQQQQQQQFGDERENQHSRQLSQSHVNVRVNPTMHIGLSGMKRSASRETLLQRADLSVSNFSRGQPLESCSFLERGVSFGGTQDVSPSVSGVKESWDLKITVEERDFSKGYVCGTMYANGFNCNESSNEKSPVVTFWEGELIDNYNHFFYTQKWGASKTTDRNHWLKLAPFCKALNTNPNQDPIDLTGQPFVYMRLKEKYFLNEEPGGNLTIAGFYYLCISRATGDVTGYYFDPNSTPFQEVKLQVIYEGENGFISAGGDLI